MRGGCNLPDAVLQFLYASTGPGCPAAHDASTVSESSLRTASQHAVQESGRFVSCESLADFQRLVYDYAGRGSFRADLRNRHSQEVDAQSAPCARVTSGWNGAE